MSAFPLFRIGLVVVALAAEAAAQTAPYPASREITGLELDWSTHRRAAQGSDNFQLAWGDDDHQYGWWGDGGGFGGTNSDGRVGLGFARVEGAWNAWRGYNVWGGKNPENPATFDGKSWGTIAVGGTLYSWIVPDVPDTGGPRDHYRYIELARSTNRGASWTKAPWRWTISDDLTVPTFLNFGRANAGARDDYVYSYFIRPQSRTITASSFGLNVHKPGAVYLARVPSARIFEGRSAYEWFTGLSGGTPTWGPLSSKAPVFQDPNGVGWCLSAIHVPGLNRYLLGTEHTTSHDSQMGLFDAPQPWGPWTTVRYWKAGDRFGETRTGSTLAWRPNIFFFAFAPKWFADGGATFTLTFTGGGQGADNDSFNTIRGRFLLPATTNRPPAASITQPATDGQSFAPGSTLFFAGTSSDPDGDAVTRAWLIDRLGDGLAAAKLPSTAASGSQVLAGSIGSVVLDAPDTDYDLILRVTDGRGLSAEAKRRYRVASATTFSVSIQSVSTGRPYSLSTARTGALHYIDRSYTITSLSSALANQIMIRTANDDKYVSSSSHLKFTITGSATVYVAYDKRATKAPTWLSGWTMTPDSVAVSDGPASPLRIYARAFQAGTITLGGNHEGAPTGAQSNYVVVVKPSSSGAREAGVFARTIEEAVWDHEGDADGDGLQDAFEIGQGTHASSADSDGDGNPDETELDSRGRTLWDVQESAASAGDDRSSGDRCGLLGAELLLLGCVRLRRRRPGRPGSPPSSA